MSEEAPREGWVARLGALVIVALAGLVALYAAFFGYVAILGCFIKCTRGPVTTSGLLTGTALLTGAAALAVLAVAALAVVLTGRRRHATKAALWATPVAIVLTALTVLDASR
jgi:hypothetical protein